MFLKRNRRKKNGETCVYWSSVESVRIARGPRQRTVATLGKLPGLDDEARVGWEHVADILDGKLHQEDFLKPAEPEPPQWAAVDLKGLSVERLRRFGDVYLGLAPAAARLGPFLQRVHSSASRSPATGSRSSRTSK